ncbi:MAG TPA: hypothetical protein PLU17_09565 [Chitinophagaceae bacterium]|jgi:hypothetical protein|nr:hypothetical protein [Chitinophagaceae bacterium]
MKYSTLILFIIIISPIIGFAQDEIDSPPCENGDIEKGDFTNFQLYIGNSTDPLDLTLFTSGTGSSGNPPYISNRHEIMPLPFSTPPTWDPYDPLLLTGPPSGPAGPQIGPKLPVVLDGLYSLRLGTPDAAFPTLTLNDNQAEIISYNFTLNTNKTLSFSWAAVMSSGENHIISCDDCPSGTEAEKNPFFRYWVSKSSNLVNSTLPTNILRGEKYMANHNDPFWEVLPWMGDQLFYPYAIPGTPTPVIYKQWHQECVDLSKIKDVNAGDNLTIYFAAGDCSETIHFGYVYLDNICVDKSGPCFTMPDSWCDLNSPLFADASCTLNDGVARHRWEWAKLNSNNINDFVPASIKSTPYIYSSLTSQENISFAYYYYFLYGSGYYQVDLILENCSGQEERYSQIIFIYSPCQIR